MPRNLSCDGCRGKIWLKQNLAREKAKSVLGWAKVWPTIEDALRNGISGVHNQKIKNALAIALFQRRSRREKWILKKSATEN